MAYSPLPLFFAKFCSSGNMRENLYTFSERNPNERQIVQTTVKYNIIKYKRQHLNQQGHSTLDLDKIKETFFVFCNKMMKFKNLIW